MITKKPIVAEIVAQFECGKTHFCSCIKNSAMIDVTPHHESDIIFAKNRTEKEFEELYHPAETLNGVIRFIRDLPENVTTICFDGSANFMHIIEKQWCEDTGRSKAYQVEYGQLYSMLNEKVITPILKRPSNIVFTSGLRDEYIGGVDDKGKPTSVKTGKKERHGVKPMEYMRDVGLNLYFDEEGKRANRIIKNRFVSKTLLKDGIQIDNPHYIKILVPEATWETLINAITVPGSALRREWIV